MCGVNWFSVKLRSDLRTTHCHETDYDDRDDNSSDKAFLRTVHAVFSFRFFKL